MAPGPQGGLGLGWGHVVGMCVCMRGPWEKIKSTPELGGSRDGQTGQKGSVAQELWDGGYEI